MTEHKHKEVMIAYANDCSIEIQYRSPFTDNWLDSTTTPVFSKAREYRIKPDKSPQIIAAELAIEKASSDLMNAKDALAHLIGQ